MIYGHEKPDLAIVAVKPTNKAERSAAELVERRAGTEGNADRQSSTGLSARFACHKQQRLRFARHLNFPNDLARVIHNADTGFLDRNVPSSKIVHAALLLLMLEAANADLVEPSA
jgi:hypothetical protein